MLKGDETFEESIMFAFGLEKGSRDFYHKAMEKVADPEAKEFFAAMADIELGHMGKVRLLYCGMDNESCPPSLEDFIESVPGAYAEGGRLVETLLKDLDVAFLDRADALKVAIRLEGDAHGFYKKAAKRMENPFARVLFENLAADEASHLERLTAELKSHTR